MNDQANPEMELDWNMTEGWILYHCECCGVRGKASMLENTREEYEEGKRRIMARHLDCMALFGQKQA